MIHAWELKKWINHPLMKRLYQVSSGYPIIHNKGAFHFQRSKRQIFITLIPPHRYWEGFVGYCVSCTCAYPLKVNGLFDQKIRLGCTMLSNRAYPHTIWLKCNLLQCVNREVSQRSPRIQDIAALYAIQRLRCKIVYVFSHARSFIILFCTPLAFLHISALILQLQ